MKRRLLLAAAVTVAAGGAATFVCVGPPWATSTPGGDAVGYRRRRSGRAAQCARRGARRRPGRTLRRGPPSGPTGQHDAFVGRRRPTTGVEAVKGGRRARRGCAGRGRTARWARVPSDRGGTRDRLGQHLSRRWCRRRVAGGLPRGSPAASGRRAPASIPVCVCVCVYPTRRRRVGSQPPSTGRSRWSSTRRGSGSAGGVLGVSGPGPGCRSPTRCRSPSTAVARWCWHRRCRCRLPRRRTTTVVRLGCVAVFPW